MLGVVSTLLECPDTAPGLLAASARLADLLGGAHIEALVVRVPPEATILPTEEVLSASQEAGIRAREQARAAALKAAYDAWAAGASQGDPASWSASWHDIEGMADAVLRERGSRADIIVLRRPREHGDFAAWHAAHVALFGTGRPVLVVPPGPPSRFGCRVALAWRDDRHATRAVLSALRCRVPPERVVVLAGLREGAPHPAMPEILVEHGVAAELHVLPVGSGVFGEALLARAHELGADLLVMGAYAHSPLREMLFGGVSRFMLARADLPLLMRH